MKIGIRKPNLKKSLKARTTGKLKRSVKSAINPFYSKKGMGWINDPEKAMYNKVYNKVTIDPLKEVKKKIGKPQQSNSYEYTQPVYKKVTKPRNSLLYKIISTLFVIFAVFVPFSNSGKSLFSTIGTMILCLGIAYYFWNKSRPVINVTMEEAEEIINQYRQ